METLWVGNIVHNGPEDMGRSRGGPLPKWWRTWPHAFRSMPSPASTPMNLTFVLRKG